METMSLERGKLRREIYNKIWVKKKCRGTCLHTVFISLLLICRKKLKVIQEVVKC